MRKAIAAILAGVVTSLIAAPAYSTSSFPTMKGSISIANGDFTVECTGSENKRWCRVRSTRIIKISTYQIFVGQEAVPSMSESVKVFYQDQPNYQTYESTSNRKIISGVNIECTIIDSTYNCNFHINKKIDKIQIATFFNDKTNWQYSLSYWPHR